MEGVQLNFKLKDDIYGAPLDCLEALLENIITDNGIIS